MNEKERENRGPEPMLEAWMKTANEFWGTAMKAWAGQAEKSAGRQYSGKEEKSRFHESFDSFTKMYQGLSAAMGDTGTMDSFCRGINSVPEILVKMTQMTWERFFHLHQKWMEKASRLGEKTEAFHFENLDQDVFTAWSELYQEEFSKYFNVPQLGLTRLYQERSNKFLDKLNLFQGALSEFMSILYIPMEKSMKVLQDKVEETSAEGKAPETFQAYYSMWIRILEGHYMTLFKTPEYIQTLSKTLNAMEGFMVARHELFEDMLQTLPVATNKDLDDLYREIYEVKKKLKNFEKRLAEK